MATIWLRKGFIDVFRRSTRISIISSEQSVTLNEFCSKRQFPTNSSKNRFISGKILINFLVSVSRTMATILSIADIFSSFIPFTADQIRPDGKRP